MKDLAKQDSKELSPRPLENAPKTFNSKKLFKLLMLITLAFNANNAPKTFKICCQSLKIL